MRRFPPQREGPRRTVARPLLCLCVLAGLAGPAHSQTADTLRAEDGGRRTATATLAATQTDYATWQDGGVNALAATAAAEDGFDRAVGRVLVQQGARAAFGVLCQDSLAVRRSEDESVDTPPRPDADVSERVQRNEARSVGLSFIVL